MRANARTVWERFNLANGRLVRELTIGDVSGTSSVEVDAASVNDRSEDGLKAIWDKEFLVGSIDHLSNGQSDARGEDCRRVLRGGWAVLRRA